MRNTPYYIFNLNTSPIADGHKGRPCKGLMRLRSLNGILLCLLLLLAGCSDKFLDSIDGGSDVPDGTPVVIDGTFVSPNQSGTATRAMGETPDIKSLYAIVFDENDLLSEIVPCQPGTYEKPQNAFTPDGGALYHTPFHVILLSSAKPRVVHLVANIQPASYSITDEVTLLKNFTVSGSTDSYWRRIALDNGITADDDGKVKDETLKYFQNITLVRNFAKVNITVDGSLSDKFKLLGYYIFNQPASGTVAPYNLNATYDSNNPTADRFAKYVLTADASAQNPASASYFELNDNQQYYGYEPSQMKLKDNPPVSADGSNDASFPFVKPGQPTYMYESTYTNGATDNPFIILKAQYRSNTSTDWANVTPTYYKADFVYTRETDQNEEVKYQYNYNVLRNLSYTLDITNVTGEGRKTIQEAINNAAMNNFMMSSESQDLKNIAADQARLYVDWTDELFTSGGTHPLKVKFIYDKDNPTTTISNWYKDETGNPNPKYYVNAKLEKLDAGLEEFIKDVTWDGTGNGSNDAEGYRTLNIKFRDDLPSHYTRQNILITCSSGLLRRATVSYIPALKMTYTVSSDPTTLPTTAGAAVKLSITIPSTLTEKRFPLHFHIYSTDNVLYPDVQASGFVEMPLTVTHNADESYYHYNRYITWSEYNAKATDTDGTTKTFPCYFKLYKDASGYSVTVSPAPNDKTSNYFSSPVVVK